MAAKKGKKIAKAKKPKLIGKVRPLAMINIKYNAKGERRKP